MNSDNDRLLYEPGDMYSNIDDATRFVLFQDQLQHKWAMCIIHRINTNSHRTPRTAYCNNEVNQSEELL